MIFWPGLGWSIGWTGLVRAELGWGGLGWAGLGRTGLGQTGLGRTMGLAELSWSGPNWTGLGQSLHCTMYICHLRLVQYIQTSRFEPISQVLTHKVKLSSPQIRSGCSRWSVLFAEARRFPIVDQAKIEYAIVNIDWWINSIAIKSANMSLLPRHMYTIE